MPRFKVYGDYELTFEIEVEAEDEDHAIKKVEDMDLSQFERHAVFENVNAYNVDHLDEPVAKEQEKLPGVQ